MIAIAAFAALFKLKKAPEPLLIGAAGAIDFLAHALSHRSAATEEEATRRLSAGIDMALYLAGEIAGRERAEAIQLGIEYDPKPCFQAGHWSKASAPVRALANKEMAKLALNPREGLSLLRLAGQTFSARLKKQKLTFDVQRADDA